MRNEKTEKLEEATAIQAAKEFSEARDSVLEQLSKATGKSQKMLLFEFEKDTHPRTFKRWLKEEQLRKEGKAISFVCGAPDVTPIIELIDEQLVETQFPQALRTKLLSEM